MVARESRLLRILPTGPLAEVHLSLGHSSPSDLFLLVPRNKSLALGCWPWEPADGSAAPVFSGASPIRTSFECINSSPPVWQRTRPDLWDGNGACPALALSNAEPLSLWERGWQRRAPPLALDLVGRYRVHALEAEAVNEQFHVVRPGLQDGREGVRHILPGGLAEVQDM